MPLCVSASTVARKRTASDFRRNVLPRCRPSGSRYRASNRPDGVLRTLPMPGLSPDTPSSRAGRPLNRQPAIGLAIESARPCPPVALGPAHRVLAQHLGGGHVAARGAAAVPRAVGARGLSGLPVALDASRHHYPQTSRESTAEAGWFVVEERAHSRDAGCRLQDRAAHLICHFAPVERRKR